MIEGRPSATAQRVALARAAHQLLDRPLVFEDRLALAIVGREAEGALRENPTRFERGPYATRRRAYLAVRARFAEESLLEAVGRGVRQIVLLGAGLDTFAFRVQGPSSALRLFEVDHPATQAWKRQRLAAAGIAIPPDLTWVAVDFERQEFGEELRRAGLDPGAPTFFSWLGVTMYLERTTVLSALASIARLAGPGGGVVLDYAVERKRLPWLQRIAVAIVAARVKSLGEPWRSAFDPPELIAEMRGMGFSSATDFDPGSLYRRYVGSTDPRDGAVASARLMLGLT